MTTSCLGSCVWVTINGILDTTKNFALAKALLFFVGLCREILHMKRSTQGHLHAYWEQGWNGKIDFAFQPEDKTRLVFLESGQTLTIFQSNHTILWSGVLRFVKRNYFDKHKLASEVWATRKQHGVLYRDWMDWFWQHPPLRAQLDVNDAAPKK